MSKTTRKTAEDLVAPDLSVAFRQSLLAWFDAGHRDLPWRRTRDPYAILVSEIMLQQTRVAAVIPFYERFLARFPNFGRLAGATESELLTYWAGLGYYYRARNLQKAAQAMCEAGEFPANYDAIRALPGVGEYTAAAVASIAFNLPFPAVDGNVLRVLSRWSANGTDIASLAGRRRFTELAGQLLARERPGASNQACMELGATICLPRNPQCLLCPVAAHCRARREGRQREFPVKLGATGSRYEERQLFWIEHEGKVLLWQRPPDARLMPGFWELPEQAQLPEVVAGKLLGAFRHGITVHDYLFEVFAAKSSNELGPCQWVDIGSWEQMPLSTTARKAQKAVQKNRGPIRRKATAGT